MDEQVKNLLKNMDLHYIPFKKINSRQINEINIENKIPEKLAEQNDCQASGDRSCKGKTDIQI